MDKILIVNARTEPWRFGVNSSVQHYFNPDAWSPNSSLINSSPGAAKASNRNL